jgi:hypothetical protein
MAQRSFPDPAVSQGAVVAGRFIGAERRLYKPGFCSSTGGHPLFLRHAMLDAGVFEQHTERTEN